MHAGNHEFLAYLKGKYPASFHGARVLELGAADLGGSVRTSFERCHYTGVDITRGHGVDVVRAAKNTEFFGELPFDTLIAFSLFEHDPDWRESLAHNLQWLRSGAMVFLTWGAEGNQHHLPEPYAAVRVADFMAHAATLPVLIREAFFECERFTPDCQGCFDVVAVRLP